MKVGSCFAGIGGIDLGLEVHGMTTVWHSEIAPGARRVMAHRFPDSAPQGDIRAMVDGLFGPPPADLVAGGPPCQGISIGNSAGRLGLEDSRSGLFHMWADLLGMVRPDWFVMEQVTGLLTSGPSPGDDYRAVMDRLKGLGYVVAIRAVNSLRYVPQTRERLIIVGHRDPRAAERALLPITRDGARHPDQGRPPRRRTPTRSPGGPGVYRKSRRPAHNGDGESWVLTDYTNTLTLADVGLVRATTLVLDVHGRPRILTPEEWEAAHGFPPGSTVAAGSDNSRWETLGNAVSPPVAERVGRGIALVEGLETEEEGDPYATTPS